MDFMKEIEHYREKFNLQMSNSEIKDMITYSERAYKRGLPNGTFNHIEINNKVPRVSLKVAIDQVITLSKSVISGLLYESLNRMMGTYKNLPVEKQVKIMPNKVKYMTALGNELKLLQDTHISYYTPHKAMLMNEDKELTAVDRTAHIYDLTDTKEIEIENVDISEVIVKPKPIEEGRYLGNMIDNVREKVELLEQEIDLSEFDIDDVIDNYETPKEIPIETDKFEELLNDEWNATVKPLTTEEYKEIETNLKPELTVRQRFDILKKTYPHDKSVRQLEFNTTIKGCPAVISNIYSNEADWNKQKKIYELDSTIRYRAQEYYCKQADSKFYMIRTF